MIKIYLSHKISGGCTINSQEEQMKNCVEAQRIGKIIQDALPMVEVYIPGGPTERFVNRAYRKGYVTVPQIMEIDCEIVKESDMIIVYAPNDEAVDGGRAEELNHAMHEQVPNYVFSDPDHAVQFIDAFFKLGGRV